MTIRGTPAGGRFVLATISLLFLTSGAGSLSGAPESVQGEIYLVRHAETEGSGADRPLSEAGRSRAEDLAERLAGVGIERILSTDTVRTLSTAEPLAQRLGLEVEIYDHERLEEVATKLRREGGRVVVVGHSNTTPELVELLGGEPGPPIAEDEHDRLYRVELPGGATVLERLGEPATKDETASFRVP